MIKAGETASASDVNNNINRYAVDSVGTDSYAITPSPIIESYVAGQHFTFKAGTANTGACTLNVNGLGAKTIKKDVSVDLATGDILSGQVVEVVYDGTNMQLISRDIASAPDVQIFTANGTWTKPANAKFVKVTLIGAGAGGEGYQGGNIGGGGGGGGAMYSAILSADLCPATVSVTRGTGGLGRQGASVPTDGGDTIFGTIATAGGGKKASGSGGGAGGTSTGGVAGGAGGNGASPVKGGGGGGAGGGTASNASGQTAGLAGTSFASLGAGGVGGTGTTGGAGNNYGGGAGGAGDGTVCSNGANGYAIITTIL